MTREADVVRVQWPARPGPRARAPPRPHQPCQSLRQAAATAHPPAGRPDPRPRRGVYRPRGPVRVLARASPGQRLGGHQRDLIISDRLRRPRPRRIPQPGQPVPQAPGRATRTATGRRASPASRPAPTARSPAPDTASSPGGRNRARGCSPAHRHRAGPRPGTKGYPDSSRSERPCPAESVARVRGLRSRIASLSCSPPRPSSPPSFRCRRGGRRTGAASGCGTSRSV